MLLRGGEFSGETWWRLEFSSSELVSRRFCDLHSVSAIVTPRGSDHLRGVATRFMMAWEVTQSRSVAPASWVEGERCETLILLCALSSVHWNFRSFGKA